MDEPSLDEKGSSPITITDESFLRLPCTPDSECTLAKYLVAAASSPSVSYHVLVKMLHAFPTNQSMAAIFECLFRRIKAGFTPDSECGGVTELGLEGLLTDGLFQNFVSNHLVSMSFDMIVHVAYIIGATLSCGFAIQHTRGFSARLVCIAFSKEEKECGKILTMMTEKWRIPLSPARETIRSLSRISAAALFDPSPIVNIFKQALTEDLLSDNSPSQQQPPQIPQNVPSTPPSLAPPPPPPPPMGPMPAGPPGAPPAPGMPSLSKFKKIHVAASQERYSESAFEFIMPLEDWALLKGDKAKKTPKTSASSASSAKPVTGFMEHLQLQNLLLLEKSEGIEVDDWSKPLNLPDSFITRLPKITPGILALEPDNDKMRDFINAFKKDPGLLEKVVAKKTLIETVTNVESVVESLQVPIKFATTVKASSLARVQEVASRIVAFANGDNRPKKLYLDALPQAFCIMGRTNRSLASMVKDQIKPCVLPQEPEPYNSREIGQMVAHINEDLTKVAECVEFSMAARHLQAKLKEEVATAEAAILNIAKTFSIRDATKYDEVRSAIMLTTATFHQTCAADVANEEKPKIEKRHGGKEFKTPARAKRVRQIQVEDSPRTPNGPSAFSSNISETPLELIKKSRRVFDFSPGKEVPKIEEVERDDDEWL